MYVFMWLLMHILASKPAVQYFLNISTMTVVSQSFTIAALFFAHFFVFLSNAQFRPPGIVQFWRNAFPSPVSPNGMADPLLVARTSRSGAAPQRVPNFPTSRNRHSFPLNARAAMRGADEYSASDGICSIPSLNPCVPVAACTDAAPAVASAVCICPTGYRGDGKKPDQGGEGCINIDECKSDFHVCDLYTQECVDVEGSYYCKCKDGFSPSLSGTECIDIDECRDPSLNNCNAETSVCRNLEGSFRCDCKDKTKIMDETTGMCRDLDECTEMGGIMNPCEQVCINRIGGVSCGCKTGYRLRADGVTCEDINECLDSTLHMCDPTGLLSQCINTVGGYVCACNINLGYRTAEDGISCKNLDECSEFPYVCGGLLSCCQDLAPPQRFACTIPYDDGATHNLPNLRSALNTVSSPLEEAYHVPFNAVNTASSALTHLPGAVSRLATNLINVPLAGVLTGFGDTSSSQMSYTGDEVGNRRMLGVDGDESNIASHTQEGKEDMGNRGYDNRRFIRVVANNLTFYEIQEKLAALRDMEGDSWQPRRLQIFAGGIGSRFWDVGSSILRSQLITNGLVDFGGFLGAQAVREGGVDSGATRIPQGTTCPFGFALGADLYRAKVYESTKHARSKSTINAGEEAQLIQPEIISEGLLENTRAVSNEVTRWYKELSKTPLDIVSATRLS